ARFLARIVGRRVALGWLVRRLRFGRGALRNRSFCDRVMALALLFLVLGALGLFAAWPLALRFALRRCPRLARWLGGITRFGLGLVALFPSQVAPQAHRRLRVKLCGLERQVPADGDRDRREQGDPLRR